MQFALVNPPWKFEGSIYFGCREAHFPLEFGYSKKLLEAAGHSVVLIDALLEQLTDDELYRRVKAAQPDFIVVTTAPSYLFWRCAPPELGVPQKTIELLRPIGGTLCVIGPHGSTTPRMVLRKTGADVVIIGEPEEILPQLAAPWSNVSSIAFWDGGRLVVQGKPHASNISALGSLIWPSHYVQKHVHHHHRFDAAPRAPGAEVEASRGCPYACTFCAKENFRNKYRRRNLTSLLMEVDLLIQQGVEYIYFIDEIFLPWREFLEALSKREVKIGIQTRIDLWSEETIDLLARASCVSVEAGVESISEAGRDHLDKKCRLSTDELSARLIMTKTMIPFVQANLISGDFDSAESVAMWRNNLIQHGVWANQPVPLFPYPGSPDYTRRWGRPDDLAWERAHAYYMGDHSTLSDIQDQNPLALTQLELPAHDR